jgi:N utilization substance protein B
MLNRRLLRVKVMQALYGLKQAEKSDFFLSLDHIADFFAPDLNSLEPQNLEELKESRAKASKVFEESFEGATFDLTKEDIPVQKSVMEARELFKQRLDKDKKHYKRQMLEEIDRLHENYILLLTLLIKLIEYSEDDETDEQNKFIKKPLEFPIATNLRQNKVFLALKNDEEIETYRIRHKLNWEKALIRKVFREEMKKDEEVIKYLKLENPGLDEDREILLHVFKNCIFKSKFVQEFFEERDFTWVENKSIVKSLMVKTLKGIGENSGKVLMDISGNWEEDKVFFEDLYSETLQKEKELEKHIEEKASNWEFERIALTDNILLKMALTEMIVFPSIPVKVSINEYIELSKNYSTPKSKQFVNGMLDSISQEFIKSGMIRKSGRGLIDNK